MLILVMLKNKEKLSELKQIVRIYPQVLINAKVASNKKDKYKEDEEITKSI